MQPTPEAASSLTAVFLPANKQTVAAQLAPSSGSLAPLAPAHSAGPPLVWTGHTLPLTKCPLVPALEGESSTGTGQLSVVRAPHLEEIWLDTWRTHEEHMDDIWTTYGRHMDHICRAYGGYVHSMNTKKC